jgi:uncharacterized protein
VNSHLAETSNTRIQSLDIIRGFALLGILVMNIQSFAMPEAAYTNPTAYGDFNGINKLVWMVSHLLFDSKFMALFSMLFGVGILVFSDNLVARGNKAFATHARRMFWLLLFGFIHGHLIWSGDILFMYAACGFVFYSFRNRTIKTLWIVGIIFLTIGWGFTELIQVSLNYMTPDEVADMATDWAPTREETSSKLLSMTGVWSQQFSLRTENAWFMQTFGVLYYGLGRVGGLMLIGMALYKQGLFTGRYAPSDLLKKGLVNLLIGFSFTIYGLFFNFQHDWAFSYSQFRGMQFNYIGSVFVAIGYAQLLALVVQKQWFAAVTKRLAYVGRMAFTNYISQSIICTFIFYGFGLGLFGSVERWQQLLIVLCIWALQLTWSPLWLESFRYGPLEWLWRTLTYWQKPNGR